MDTHSYDAVCSALCLLYGYSVALEILVCIGKRVFSTKAPHLWNSYLCLWSEVAQINDILPKKRQLSGSDYMDLRKNDKSRKRRYFVEGLWELLLIFSCILPTGYTFNNIVGMVFCMFYFLPCEPGRALIAFQEMCTRIFKNVSHKWQPSEVIWNPQKLKMRCFLKYT